MQKKTPYKYKFHWFLGLMALVSVLFMANIVTEVPMSLRPVLRALNPMAEDIAADNEVLPQGEFVKVTGDSPGTMGMSSAEQMIAECAELGESTPGQNRPGLPKGEPVFKRNEFVNIHYQGDDGQVYRLRLFNDDNSEGARKFVLYKENADGFPEIQAISEQEQYPEDDSVVEKYTEGKKIMFKEEAYFWGWETGETLYFVLQNGKLKSIDYQDGDGLWECVR